MGKTLNATSLLGAALLGAAVAGLAALVSAGSHAGHSAHTNNNSHGPAMTPTETGQAAFAAMAEIVEMLDNDPSTDWSSVNIDVLRDHLVDMERLTTDAVVTRAKNGDTITFSITGPVSALAAARRMVPAHADQLATNLGWNVETKVSGDAVKLNIEPNEAVFAEKIWALGFFGIMATGAHHQPHHLGMAMGTMQH